MVCINLVNRAARSSTSGLLARPWLTWGTGWERTGDEMGVVSCCGRAAERTEAPGRAPEGVKPRCCGQMDAKGNKVIKEEEAERRRQVKTGGGVGLVESGWCGTALAARAMWVVFFIFSISILESCLFIFSFSD